ncbi:hypothetical protein E6W39_18840 [Kitasatospora acidiphila]|uniref:Uncharacterized protein n=1 Tax=Kitasatospora acidiphila TaxID=2567942 RepID=A0A540W4F2_9ACTN|nr:ParB N-terminal domain-containing protein [Kitasatospora acidiphila]TQF03911.1 hypothetical protein E6W39_18840 [Kitasatospora acidiphila]
MTIGMITLSEVLDFRAGDADAYDRCSGCGKLARIRVASNSVWCCGSRAYARISTVRDVLEIKRDDSHYADLMDSIRHHGIGLPILIYGREVHNGHHRIAAAFDLGLEEIPWTNDSSIGWEEDWPDDSVLDCGA